RLTEAGLLKSGGRQRTDATYVLAAVRRLSRLELAGESLRAALEELAVIAPEWLLPQVEPEWDKRYGRRIEIRKVPGGPEAVIARAEVFGRDGQKVLAGLWSADAPGRLRTLPQVQVLRQVWVHHYYWDEEGQLRWRDGHALPPASLRFDSPYDTDAHYCTKNGTEWSGYRVHYTETCEEQRPEIVVHVATTIAPVQDGQLTGQIHDDLAQTALTPAEHVVDAAYITPAHVQRAQQVHGITLLGPIVADHSRQAKSGKGFGKSAFTINWGNQQATCPQGNLSREWRPLRISGHDYIQVKFDKATCRACPVRTQCTDAVSGPRSLALLPTRELHEIQQSNRLDQQTGNWQRRYAIRAGIEATLSQTVRSNGLRRTRYRGLAKTHVQHILTAMACNLTRTADWIAETPRGRTRSSRFHTLCTAATG
ncbi:transposase, partial [Streptomyces sp. NPDC005784]|uniref:transposase n=1 Tax=Streptomyces sp. NPDC005784 TaxID=3364731 RepID=UPI0036A68367